MKYNPPEREALKGEALEYFDTWMQWRKSVVRRKAMQSRDKSRVETPPLGRSLPYLPYSRYRVHTEPPFWFTDSQVLAFLKKDLAEADAQNFSIRETKAVFSYMFVRDSPTSHVHIDNGKVTEDAKRNTRAERRSHMKTAG